MSAEPVLRVDPFACPVQPMRGKPHVHDELRAAGRLVRAQAPAGGPAWVVTDYALAKEVLADPRMVKDPTLAPEGWHGVEDGLDCPVPELRPFTLIAVDGEDHRRLRRVHAPAFNPRRLAAEDARLAAIARNLFRDLADASAASGEPAELIDGFAYNFPLLVICGLLGVPVTDPVTARKAVSAMKAMALGTAGEAEDDTSSLEELLGRAVRAAMDGRSDSMTRVLYERARAEFGDVSADELTYMIMGLIFAGHDTTGSFLGFLLAETLAGHLAPDADPAEFVERMLREHPPVPYTLWRFASRDLVIDGVPLPRGAPVLVDIEGINARSGDKRLTFGDGAHYCIGEQLAQLESKIMISVLREEYPEARLAVPFEKLRWGRTGSQTARLTELPVWLRP
ncbi:cytochrome P450 [Nonomuraea sp. MCN248]|uniref:Cytochrome P450 n=1 Tax=Nonomuraea corallina TaxID=2989783 RepID=A0ABT4S6E0_9ACTN|nr:cytochrome P450 [Nonomuraea corallina]MDA0632758.1 cytochrome P450 [Nonomuraea corallina]